MRRGPYLGLLLDRVLLRLTLKRDLQVLLQVDILGLELVKLR